MKLLPVIFTGNEERRMKSYLTIFLYLCFCVWDCTQTNQTVITKVTDIMATLDEKSRDDLQNRINATHVLIGAIKKIIQYMGWGSLTITFDEKTELFVAELSEELQKIHTLRYRLLRASSNMDRFQSLLLKFYLGEDSHYKNFLVVCGAETFIPVMRMANTFDNQTNRRTYMRHHSQWLLVTSHQTFPAVAAAVSRLDHVAILKIRHEIDSLETGYVNCSDYSSSCCMELLTLLWVPEGRGWSAVGYVGCHGLVVRGEMFPNIQLGFNRRQFIVNIKEWPGFVLKSGTGSSVTYSGFCVDLLKDMAYKLNFTYLLVGPPDGKYGSLKNGRWTGVVGQLVRREVDFTVAAITRNAARDLVIDYISTPLLYDYKDIVYRKLSSEEGKWRLLLDVYHPVVLLCLTAAFIITSLLLFTLQLYCRGRDSRGKTSSILMNSVWYILGAIFHQGGKSVPTSSSGRILVASWWLLCIVMASVYSANLIAYLAVPIRDKPFNSLKELLQNKDYKWGVNGGGSTQFLISTSLDPDIQIFWEKIVEFNKTDNSVLTGNMKHQFQRVLSEKYAMVYGHEKQGEQVDCHVEYLGVKLFVFSKGIAVPAGSPLKTELDNIMLNMLENGVLRKLSKKWIQVSSSCEGDTSVGTPRVGLTDIQSAFYVLLIGLGGAALILLLEFTVNSVRSLWFSNKQNKHHSHI